MRQMTVRDRRGMTLAERQARIRELKAAEDSRKERRAGAKKGKVPRAHLPPLLMLLADFARRLGMSPDTAHRHIEDRRIPLKVTSIGHIRYVLAEDAMRFLDTLQSSLRSP